MPTGESSSEVTLAFASCTRDLVDEFVEETRKMGGLGLPVYLVSEFQPEAECHWIPWHPFEDADTNLGRIRWHLGERKIRFSCILMQPNQPYWDMRRLGVRIAPGRVYLFNDSYGHFPLSARGLPQLLRYGLWQLGNLYRSQTQAGGKFYTYLWRLRNPFSLERPFYYRRARGRTALDTLPPRGEKAADLTEGITVVIPSRQGRHLLEALLPRLRAQNVDKVLIVDNGSDDNTAALAEGNVEVIVERLPMSFAAAVNAGIRAARTTHVCLLNNDMAIEEGFFEALRRAFDRVPDLFCATAQIYFPKGKRREETGKAVWSQSAERDFPLRCATPVDGENDTPVLYGSGGCSLYDTRKLLEIGCFKEAFRPAYVEDLDAGWRGWQRGWPTVFAAGAKVVHFHRSTTARFISASSIELAIEINYLRWILGSVATAEAFDRLWKQATWRLNLLAAVPEPAPIAVYSLRFAAFHKPYYKWDRPAPPAMDEEEILALGSGEIACFPGHADTDRPRVLIATSYMPFPLSHGGAVRMFNLMREAAKDYSLVLMSFVDEFHTPAPELLGLCVEVIQILREGTHYRRSTPKPKTVEEFESEAFRAAIGWVKRRWEPEIAQLEFTQMAQYADACAPAKTLLVEHDVTLDLYDQLLRGRDDYDLRLERTRWDNFERDAWRRVDCVAVMSNKDRAIVERAKRVEVIENGVDIDRFHPSETAPDPGRILFIGTFAHLPNLIGLDWFLREVWPSLKGMKLHVITGRNAEYFAGFHAKRLHIDWARPDVEMEGFVGDVRPAYERAEIVIAPLLASAGTNIKVLEAMACGKAIVATPGGVNGIECESGKNLVIASAAADFAAAIQGLHRDRDRRKGLERQARQWAERRYGWASIGIKQRALYQSLRATTR